MGREGARERTKESRIARVRFKIQLIKQSRVAIECDTNCRLEAEFKGEVERELRRPKVWRFGREGNYYDQVRGAEELPTEFDSSTKEKRII